MPTCTNTLQSGQTTFFFNIHHIIRYIHYTVYGILLVINIWHIATVPFVYYETNLQKKTFFDFFKPFLPSLEVLKCTKTCKGGILLY